MKKEKCFWCSDFAVYGGFNMNKMPRDAKESDAIPEGKLVRYACENHRDNLKQWTGSDFELKVLI